MNGYDFVLSVLTLTDFEIEPLLALANSQETEWLEFKAATLPHLGNFKPGENEYDYRWHVAKAMVAMANTSGGAVLVGLNETKISDSPIEYVPLSSSGFSDNWDDFVRKFDEQVVSPKKGWSTGKDGKWEFSQGVDSNQFELRKGAFDGKPILVVLVRPGPLIMLNHSVGNAPAREVMLRRRPGDIGKVECLVGYREIGDYDKTRVINKTEFDEQFATFKTQRDERVRANQQEIQIYDVVRQYAKTAISNIKKELEDGFTTLDGEERLNLDKVRLTIDQQATESFENYWADDDADDINLFDDGTVEFDEQAIDLEEELEEERDDSTSIPARRGVIFDLIESKPKVVILGDSGAGKSTCLKFLHLKWAVEFEKETVGQVAMYLPLSRFRGDLWSLCRLNHLGVNQLSVDQVNFLAVSGRLTLLLDGLNECPPNHLASCIKQISNAVDGYPLLKLVLTCRVRQYDGFLKVPVFILSPMSEDRQVQYLNRGGADLDRSSYILNILNRQPGGRKLASNPYLLKLAVSAITENENTPLYPLQLHRRFLEKWYAREEKKAILSKTKLRWSFELVKKIISELAFRSRFEGYFADCEVEWVRSFLDKRIETDVDDFFDFLAGGMLFSGSDDSSYLRFIHESVQETLAADYILKNKDLIGDIVLQPKNWRMVIAHLITSGEPFDGEQTNYFARVDPWFAVCSSAWNASSIAQTTWISPKIWCDAACQLAIGFAMRDSSWESAAKEYFKLQCDRIKKLLAFIKVGLLEYRDIQGENWDQMLSFGLREIAYSPSKLGAIFPFERVERITKTCQFKVAIYFYAHGISSKEIVRNRIDEWKSLMTIGKAATFLRYSDLFTSDDFIDCREKWLKNASPTQAKKWVHAGLASWEEFESLGINHLTPQASEGNIFVRNYKPLLQGNIQNSTDTANINALRTAFLYGVTVSAVVISVNESGFEVLVYGCPAFMPRSLSGSPFGMKELAGATINVVVKEFRNTARTIVEWAGFKCKLKEITDAFDQGKAVCGLVVGISDDKFHVDCGGIWASLLMGDISLNLRDRWEVMLKNLEIPDESLYFKVIGVDSMVYKKNIISRSSIRLRLAEDDDDVDQYLILRQLEEAKRDEFSVEGRVQNTIGNSSEISFGSSVIGHINKGVRTVVNYKFQNQLKTGDVAQFFVKEVNYLSGKAVLYCKEIDPWAGNEDILRVGVVLKGRVVKHHRHGCSVELKDGVTGYIEWKLIPISMKSRFNLGYQLDVLITSVDSVKRRIGLDMVDNPLSRWDNNTEILASRNSLLGKVVSVAKYGYFVEIDECFTGLLHITAFSEDLRRCPANIGDTMCVRILSRNVENKKLYLGLAPSSAD